MCLRLWLGLGVVVVLFWCFGLICCDGYFDFVYFVGLMVVCFLLFGLVAD